jgi:diaminopimelate epimerase
LKRAVFSLDGHAVEDHGILPLAGTIIWVRFDTIDANPQEAITILDQQVCADQIHRVKNATIRQVDRESRPLNANGVDGLEYGRAARALGYYGRRV